MNESFCIYPWIHTHFHTNGQLKLCCVSKNEELVDEEGEPLNIQTHSLKDIWNSPAMREVRRKMLAGEKVSACERCYHEESLGQSSHRGWANQHWLGNDEESQVYVTKVQRSMTREYRVDDLPVYYDIRPGNQCNLACRMCNSDFSSLIEADPVAKQWLPREDRVPGRAKGGKPWYRDEDILIGELLENIEQTRKFLFAGGEPLINPVIRKVIDILVERGAAPNIILQFSTNTTFFDESFFAKMAEFKEANFMLSIDGIEAEYEYIRHPGKWEVVRQNLEKMRDIEHINCTVTPTVQSYNALGLARLLEYCEELGFGHMLNFLYSPTFLSVRVMPRAAKELAAARLRDYAGRSALVAERPVLKDRIEAIIQEFDFEPQGKSYEESMHEFMAFCNDLDDTRDQSFAASCPEFYQLILEDGFDWASTRRFAA